MKTIFNRFFAAFCCRRNKPKKFEDVKTYSDLLLQLWSDDELFIITKSQLIAATELSRKHGKHTANY